MSVIRWNLKEVIIILLVLYLSEVIIGAFLIYFIHVYGFFVGDLSYALHLIYSYKYFPLSSRFSGIVFSLGFILYIIKKKGHSIKDIGIDFEKINIRNVFIGLIAAIGCIGLSGTGNGLLLILIRLWSESFNLSEEKIPIFCDDPIIFIYWILETIIIVPILEEVIFRGVIYTFLRNKIKKIPAILISSLLFTIAHFDISRSVGCFLTGIILAYLYEKKKSIIPCIIAHFFINFLPCMFHFFILKI